ncbi:MAG TPA: serine hydrolase [Burkholderiaceae bacterium]
MGTFDDAIAFARARESPWSRDPGAGPWGVHGNDPPPHDRMLGPVSPRGPCSGVVVVGGEERARWGEPDREDLTFSVAKTYLALLAGVAFDRGLLADVDEPVARRVPGIGFEGARNGAVTWAHLLHQTSEWEGSCFGIPDTVDRYRRASFDPSPPAGRKGDARPLGAPGTYWEYNDVRINQLSLALLHLFGRALPEVFAEAIAAPSGASAHWRWRGYDNAWVEVGGHRVQSVPGGSHWGGGVSIDCFDQARIGQMLLRGGVAGGRRVLSSEWIARMLAPCALAPFYGYLVWLNRNRVLYPSLPESSWFAVGAGTSIVWIDPDRDAVVVLRWIDSSKADAILARFSQALSVCAKDLGVGVKRVPGEPEQRGGR